MGNNVRERIAEIETELEELDMMIWKLKSEREELSKELKGWFIGNKYCGNGDYWDEFIYPLGFITEDEARKWAEENNDYPVCGDYWPGSAPAYYEVSEDEFRLYIKWQKLTRALINVPYGYDDCQSIRNAIDSKIDEIVSGLSNKEISENSSFIHISIKEAV